MIGIIGGTGFYQLEGLKNLTSRQIETPFGAPSAPVVLADLGEQKIAFLARHGEKHQYLPSEVNFRANIWALKAAGVRKIIAVSAVGSLSENIHPGDLALVSQYIDFTKGRRQSSFFGDGIVAHVSTAEPACRGLTARIKGACQAKGIKIHADKSYACVEGPRFGTRAESFFLRGAGCHLVGMTNVPEAFLAREAQLCYCCIAVATDYDCWMEDPAAHASMDAILDLYKKNLIRVQQIIKDVIEHPHDEVCRCGSSLNGAVMTPESSLSPEKREYLRFLKS